MTLVVGLDTGSRKWHAVDSDDRVAFDSVPKSWDVDRARLHLAGTWREFAATLPADTWICCEEPLSLQNPKTNIVLAFAANGLWMATFFPPVVVPMTFAWHWVDVSHWKRTILGDGNGGANKEQVAAWVLEHDPPPAEHAGVYNEELDLYDARCIRNFGLLWLTTGQKPATKKPKKKRARRKT